MPILDCIIALFVFVHDRMTDVPSHPQEKLTPAELVTIGLLYALKGVNQSAFYRWLFHNYGNLFPQLPERTRLFRRLATRSDWTDRFLEDAHLLAIADSYGVELIHPRRHGRDKTNQAKKGLSNHRWIAGVKVCALINAQGRIVDWQWDGANTHDQHFREMIARYPHTAVLTDSGFHGRQVSWTPGQSGQPEPVSAGAVQCPLPGGDGFLALDTLPVAQAHHRATEQDRAGASVLCHRRLQHCSESLCQSTRPEWKDTPDHGRDLSLKTSTDS